MNETLLPYATAIIAIILVVILALLQSFAGTFVKFAIGKGIAGVPVGDSHNSFPFRMERAHQNMVENLTMFALTSGVAIAVGVDPTWVNWVATIFLVARTGHWLCYALGIASLRTLCFAVGFFSTLALAIRTLLTVI